MNLDQITALSFIALLALIAAALYIRRLGIAEGYRRGYNIGKVEGIREGWKRGWTQPRASDGRFISPRRETTESALLNGMETREGGR